MTVIILLSAVSARANPLDGVVSAGSASISSSGKKLDVHQSSDKVVIDWRSFDIDIDEHTQFYQPSSSSIALNRVNNGDPSKILGQLSANGNIVLVNPNGVLFGQSAKVDVNGLVATTADIDNDAFMNNDRLNFDKPGNPDAVVANHGTITAKEAGLVGLVAPNVANHGIIEANMGRVHLASGDTATIDFYGDDLMEVAVSDDVQSQLVINTGNINAAGGKIAITAAAGKQIVNNLVIVKGEIRAPAVVQRNGEIIIFAEGSNAVKNNKSENKGIKQGESGVIVSAALDVSGRNAGEKGGKVTVTGDNVALLDGTFIDASGHDGKSGTTTGLKKSAKRDGSAGGEILIGGDYLGTGDTPNAKNLYVDSGVLVLNDSLNSGDAGRTIFWSDDTTEFYGNVYSRAMGGLIADPETWHASIGGNAGDGGFVETSGHGHLDAGGYVDLTASNGSRGTYFLDPTDITIYGNVNPAFVSTDNSINLASSLKLWLDASDSSQVTLTYRSLATTATGTSGANTITVSSNANLVVGARIRLGGAGSVTAASTLGSDTYTITNISGTTITLSSNLTQNYTTSAIHQGYVSQWTDKSGLSNNATQATANNMPLFVTNHLNGNSVIYFGTNMGMVIADSLSLSAPYSVFTMFNRITSGGYARALQGRDANWLVGPYTDNIGHYAGNCVTGVYSCAGTPVVLGQHYITAAINNSTTSNFYANDVNITLNSGYVTAPGRLALGVSGTYAEPTLGNIPEVIIYNTAFSTNARNIVEQYQSAKWGIALTPPGAGATEVDKATASNGFSVFTTRYLERLSQSADISLQATNNINLDLKGDTLAMFNGRNFTMTAGNDVLTASAGTIQTSGAGSISINAGRDINFSHDLDLTATGTGTVSLFANNSILSSGSGDITTQGTQILLNSDRDASGAGAISLGTGSTLTSNGGIIKLGGGSGIITANAGYAAGTSSNVQGIIINGATITSAAGNIIMNGRGYNNSGTADLHGIWVREASVIQSTTGDISLYGEAGAGTTAGNDGWGNIGVYLGSNTGTASSITSVDGDILLSGLAGTGNLTWNAGTVIYKNSGISSTGTGATAGNITINGTASGASGSNQDGIGIEASSNAITTVDGDISLSGVSSRVQSQSYGIKLLNSGVRSSGDGLISLNAQATTAARDIQFINSTIGGATASGNFTLNADSYDIASNPSIQTSGNVAFAPRTASTTIGLAGGAGTLGLTSALLNNISAGSVTIGRTDGSGVITANAQTWLSPVTLQSNTGNINIDGLQTMGNRSFFARTYGAADIIFGASGGISSSASGTPITLVSNRNFINNAGSGALSASSGRWLVYSTNPSNDTVGSLSNNFRRFSCTYGGSCPALGTGNGLLYSYTPTLTATPGALTISYSDAVPSLTGYTYNLTGYLGSDAAADSVIGSLDGSTTYTQNSNAGTYNINYSAGSLASAMGYNISTYANNANALTVTPRALTVTVDSKSKDYSQADPVFTGSNNLTAYDAGLVSWSYNPQSYSGTAGTYTITASASDPGNRLGNYNITYVNGQLTVTGNPLPATSTLPATVVRVSQLPITMPISSYGSYMQTSENNSKIINEMNFINSEKIATYLPSNLINLLEIDPVLAEMLDL